MATKQLFQLGFFCAVAAFLLMFLGFSTPYWYKSWTRVHSPFSNIGLWHVCLAGYIQPKDPLMKSYVGCWWIHSSEFSYVSNSIQPSWFRGIQALAIFTLLCDFVGGILLLLNIPDIMYRKLYAGRRVKILFIAGILELVAAGLVFLIALVFAEMSMDPTWMPRPWMNYLSWSYGVSVLSGFFSAFAGMLIFINALIFRDKENGIIGSDTLDTRMENIKKKESEAMERMRSQPPAYSGAESYKDPSMGYPSTGYPSTGYPSTGYPSTGGFREPSVSGDPGYPMKPREHYDAASYQDKMSIASSQDRPRVYPESSAPRAMYSGQPRSDYRRQRPRIDQGYQARAGSQSSVNTAGSKVGESVV